MSATAPKGFMAAGVAAGIKPGGANDLTIVAADAPATAAAVFTVNQFAAAPVLVSKEHLATGTGVRAVVISSGCANAGTGKSGLANAHRMAAEAANRLGCEPSEILVCSTGSIGCQLPMDAISAGIAEATRRLAVGAAADEQAARGIMTTDSVPKMAMVAGAGFTVGGIAKGVGMVRPDMATMLAVLTTDAEIDSAMLDAALRDAVDRSFHELNIDGCPSTNDTVIALASGASGVTPSAEDLRWALRTVTRDLAEQLVADAEGGSRVVTLDIRGAADDPTARAMGRAISDSALVRSAFYGGDPNWGRLAGALGATDHPVDLARLSIWFSGVEVARAGVSVSHDEQALAGMLEKGDFTVVVEVGDGPGSASVLTSDLTPAYVEFNGERS